MEVIIDNETTIEYLEDIGKWEAQIMGRRFYILLGYFKTEEEAQKACTQAMDYKISEWKRLNPGKVIPDRILLNGVQSDFYSKYHLRINQKYYNFPEWYNDKQKKELCNQFIEVHPHLFHYELPKDGNDRTPKRAEAMLSTLAAYLTNKYNKGKGKIYWETKFKQEKRWEHEIPSCGVVDSEGNPLLEF
ncbi:hypothetical protein [Eubacterium barkeri]|uniref:Uncharacterized protein n=1 Tax=Eubacterium barkeri TaxID=1528 RepID=A0A1H3G866_EUBBA|nr:hypothetical protein [Eubacterium barkeri]SDX99227.1 hypothetical protein SAMN04488579_1134 [Eubacterium barkeri]